MCMPQEALEDYILSNQEALQSISSFVIQLDQLGLIRSFINGENLDKLMAELRKLNVFTGDLAQVDFSSETLNKDYVIKFSLFFAQELFRIKIYEESEIVPFLGGLIRHISKPKNAYTLYSRLFEYSAQISNTLIHAIDAVQPCTVNQYNNLREMLAAAVPGVAIPRIKCSNWIYSKYRTFEKLDFSPIWENEPFEECFKAFFSDSPTSPSGYSKEKTHEEIQYIFKCLLLDEIFEEIPNQKNRTVENINQAIGSMLETRSIYVYVRYVKAFFVFTIEDIQRTTYQYKSMEANLVPPASYHNGYGDIPS